MGDANRFIYGIIAIGEGQIFWLNGGEVVVEYECESERHKW